MSFRPFVHLPSTQYLRNDGPDIGAGPFTSVTPACTRAEEIDAGLAVLFEIDQAHKVDLEANAAWLPDRWTPSEHATIELRHVGPRLPRFKAREVWRIGSYVMFWCTLEQVVKHEYRQILGLLQRIAPGAKVALEGSSITELEDRDAEMRPIRELRNKIFAHTAYAEPRGDDLATQFTSLVHFSGADFVISKAGVALGGTTVIPDRHGIAPHFRSGTQRFEEVTVSTLVERAVQHFVSWWSMYKIVLAALQAMPDADVRAAWPAVVRVIRQPEQGGSSGVAAQAADATCS